MRIAIQHTAGQPVRVKDDQTHVEYVLLPLDLYERMRNLVVDDSFDVRDSYAAQSAVAGAAGWDDAEMDVYDNYDAHRHTK